MKYLVIVHHEECWERRIEVQATTETEAKEIAEDKAQDEINEDRLGEKWSPVSEDVSAFSVKLMNLCPAGPVVVNGEEPA